MKYSALKRSQSLAVEGALLFHRLVEGVDQNKSQRVQ